MQEELTQANNDLAHQITVLQELLGQAQIPGVLSGYRGEIESICEELRQRIRRNLKDLSYGQPDVHENVLRQTQQVMLGLEIVNSRYVAPILRSRDEDRLTLWVLRWLHEEHPMTAQRSFAMSDGPFGIYPHPSLPALYFLPCSRQRTLLYLPLLFHEFGHLLYAIHKVEMDELVGEFQDRVSDVLAPATVRKGPTAEQQAAFREHVVLAYYDWLQEFFCDAVGLRIGGPCYLKAFARYFQLQGSREFFVSRDEQIGRNHPVGWLRVRSLVYRASDTGLSELAQQVETMWRDTARMLKISEDYEGTWSDELFLPLQQTLDDMLEESNPRACRMSEVTPAATNETPTPVALLNQAWRQLADNVKGYSTFERESVRRFST